VYAHQVIEDFSARLKDSGDPAYLRAMSLFITKLRKAHHFHIGEVEKFRADAHGALGIVPVDQDSGLWLAVKDLEDTHLPYPLCWIDFIEVVKEYEYERLINSVKSQQVRDALSKVPEYMRFHYVGQTKVGILVEETEKNVIECGFAFYHLVRRLWQLAAYKARIKINGTFEDGELSGQEVLLMYHSMYDHLNDGIKYALKGNILIVLTNFLSFLKVVSCKNVTTAIIDPSGSLNKKRKRSGKQELFSYHVLTWAIPGKKKSSVDSNNRESTEHNRVHFCRAYWKEYTSERPLMGKFVGRYLWQSHVRGQSKEGIVTKDYNVKVKGDL